LFRLIFIDLQNVGVISAAPCIVAQYRVSVFITRFLTLSSLLPNSNLKLRDINFHYFHETVTLHVVSYGYEAPPFFLNKAKGYHHNLLTSTHTPSCVY